GRVGGGDVDTGDGGFETAHEVAVGNQTIGGDRIFINVGGRALVPPMAGLDRVPFLTNSSMMDLDVVPPHLVMVGGGYVCLEFGQMFRRFGSEVTIIEMASRLVQREDPDISTTIQDVLIGEGITLRLNARCIRISGQAGAITAHVDWSDGSPSGEGTDL